MKKVNKIYSLGAGILLSAGLAATLSGCSDDFLADKRPFGSYGPEQVYADWTSVKLRLNYLYEKSLPFAGGYAGKDYLTPDIWSLGLPDQLANNTDEFTGYGSLNDPTKVWDNTNCLKFFWYGINESPWKKIRECNDVLENVEASATLNTEEKKLAKGQALFFRASRFYRLFKRFGGVPNVTTMQGTLMSDSLEQRVPRNTTAETYNLIINDLKTAADCLPARWEDEANDWGRITSGACYALAGITANYYASPVFNRADDKARWQEAYEINKKALELLASGSFGLAYENNPGTNASNWAQIWTKNIQQGDGNLSEGVFVTICNTVFADDRSIYNCWENAQRPSNARGGGGISPSAELIDDFPMADGKRPDEAGLYKYDSKLFFLNRDPRFYRTFAFPGVEWKFDGTINSEEYSRNCPYLDGNKYALYSIAWYNDETEAQNIYDEGYYADFLGGSGKSVYIRKKTQDQSLSCEPFCKFNDEDGFEINGQPAIGIRYTEVLLNYAEAACGIGNLQEAYDILKRIRQRVGYTGDCGLNPEILSDRAKMFEALLYERRIELAFEGKRFDDCHRWMLFDGGVGQDALNPGWGLTGWQNNTCAYLGVTPLNDRPRHQIEVFFKPEIWKAGKSTDNDPFNPLTESLIEKKIAKPTALTLKEDLKATATVDAEGNTTYEYADEKVQALVKFYMDNLNRKDIPTQYQLNADSTTNVAWQPNLYLMGLQTAEQSNNQNVEQTIGWNSYFGGMGTFDPLK